MAFAFDFDPVHRILRSTFSGEVTDEELLNHQRVGALLVTSLQPRLAFIDFSAVDSFEATADGMRELAKLAPAMPQRERPRVIVAPSDRVFAMAQIFQVEGAATRPNLHVVRSVTEAWAILGVEMKEARFGPITGAAFAR